MGGLTVALASIIVPCFNQLEFTRHCLRALYRHTRPPWELIVIDNGSTDGTGMYLAGVQDGSPVPVTVIANAAKGASRGQIPLTVFERGGGAEPNRKSARFPGKMPRTGRKGDGDQESRAGRSRCQGDSRRSRRRCCLEHALQPDRFSTTIHGVSS